MLLVPAWLIRKADIAKHIVMLSSYVKFTPAPLTAPPTVWKLPSPVMVWSELKSILRLFDFGRANPPSVSLPLPLARKDVAVTIPLTTREERVPSLDSVTELFASTELVTLPGV